VFAGVSSGYQFDLRHLFPSNSVCTVAASHISTLLRGLSYEAIMSVHLLQVQARPTAIVCMLITCLMNVCARCIEEGSTLSFSKATTEVKHVTPLTKALTQR